MQNPASGNDSAGDLLYSGKKTSQGWSDRAPRFYPLGERCQYLAKNNVRF